MRVRTFVFTSLMTSLLLASSAAAQQKKESAQAKGQFSRAEVAAFEVAGGVEFPAHYLTTMNAEIVAQLQARKKFKEVVTAAAAPANGAGGESPAEDAGTVRISGVVTKYQGGNRAARYLVGFGAGRTKIVARVKFTDAASGRVLLEKDVDGKVVMGMFGGEAIGATRGLAKEVAKEAEKAVF